MIMLCLFILLYILVSSSIVTITADRVDKAIANAILLPNSPLCQGDGGKSTTFNSIFHSTSNISNWHEQNAKYEENVFEIDIIHEDSNVNRSWSLRVGKGGQIVSFIGPYGEAISNQAREKSVWNDLVHQSVVVNTERNLRPPYEAYKHFIHGSGVYMKDDGMPPPFYNPKLALDCVDNQCTIVNWGQQAHVPTVHRSDILYYAKYRDCGNGVIEYDQVIHHYGNDTKDVMNYVSTPWTGVRTSTFRDVLVANTSASLVHDFPLKRFGDGTGPAANLIETGGFTSFAQYLKLENDTYDPGFCVDLTANATINETAVANVDCTTNGSVPFQLVVQTNESARFSSSHAADRYDYPVIMNACNYAAPILKHCRVSCQLYFVNRRTNYSVPVDEVIQWCSNGKNVVFNSPVVDVSTLNEEFIAGDTILIKYQNDKRMATEDNLALTFVHGTNPEYDAPGNDWFRAPSRLNYGVVSPERDGTVWTTAFLGYIHPGETYFNRKYMITDRLSEMEPRAPKFITETFEDLAKMDDLEYGEDIALYYDDLNSFGAAIGNDREQCSNHEKACVGSSIPKNGFVPLFYITCGESRSYLGSNAYHFIPDTGSLLKPYLCKDEDLSVRPTYKMLGFFREGSCNVIGSRAYAAELCPEPTNEPTPIPSSSMPSSLPSLSIAPSAVQAPSSTPSQEQSEQPTSLPSLSASPSGARGGRDAPAKPTTPTTEHSNSTSTAPTSAMSMSPTLSVQTFSVPVSMILRGLSEELEKGGSAFLDYQNITSDTIEDELRNVTEHPLLELKAVTNIEEQVASTNVLPTRHRKLLKTRDASMRSQQNDAESQLKIRSLTHISFKSTSTDHDVISLVGGSFDTEEDQERYIADLQGSHSTFNSVTSVDVQVIGTTIPPLTIDPPSDDRDYIPYIIVGASVGGVGLLLLSVLLFARRRKRQANKSFDRSPTSIVSEHDGEKAYGTFTPEPADETLDGPNSKKDAADGNEGSADSSIGNGDDDPRKCTLSSDDAVDGPLGRDVESMKDGTCGGENDESFDSAGGRPRGGSRDSNTADADPLDSTDVIWNDGTEGGDGGQRCTIETDVVDDERINTDCSIEYGDDGPKEDTTEGKDDAALVSDGEGDGDGDGDGDVIKAGTHGDELDGSIEVVCGSSSGGACVSDAAAMRILDDVNVDKKGNTEGEDGNSRCINEGVDCASDVGHYEGRIDSMGEDTNSANSSHDMAQGGSIVSTEGTDVDGGSLEKDNSGDVCEEP